MERASGGHAAGFGALLRAHRHGAGLTQHELSSMSGVSVAAVRDLEQGRRRRPRAGSVARLAAALGLTGAQAEQFATAAREAAAVLPVAADLPRLVPARGLWLQVLGPLTVWRDGSPAGLMAPGQRAVLALLALSPDRLVHRDAIIDALWGEHPPVTAVNLVQAYVSRLRRWLDPGRSPRDPGGLLASTGASYRLHVTPSELDLLAFGEVLTRAQGARLTGDTTAACARYEEALGLWQGEPLADVEILRRDEAVAELARRRTAAVMEYAEVACASGLPHQVLPHLRALTRREPLNESAHAQLMIALAASGDQAAALQVFGDLRCRLNEQLGVYPGVVVADAHARVLRQELPVAAQEPAARKAAERAGSPVGMGAHDPLAPRQLPTAAPHFVGRTAELKSLSGLLTEVGGAGGTVVISAIGGTAGIGKTALALHWAHEVAAQFPDGQLYVNLRGFDPSAAPVVPAEAVRGFLDALQVPVERMPTGLEAQVGLYRSLAAGRRLLIVLDNARDAAQVRPLLPGSPSCLVLVTSRSQLTGLLANEGARPLTLDVLTEPEARELLSRRLGARRLAAEPVAAADLIALCARLPLALSIAAARAAAHPCNPLATLADELRDARSRLDALDTGDPVANVRAVFSWSYQDLSAAAARMFRLLGVHQGPDISAQAVASLAGIGCAEAREALAELTRAYLLAEHVPGRFAFHDLLRAYAAEQARAVDSAADRRAASRRVLDHYLHTAHAASTLLSPMQDRLTIAPPMPGVTKEEVADYRQALSWCEAEHRALLTAINHAASAGLNAHSWQLAWCFTPFLDLQGHWNDWAAMQRTALAAARREGDESGQARACHYLGRAYARLRCYDEAQAHLSEANGLYQRLGDHAGQARTHLAMGRAAEARDGHGEALGHALRAQRLYRTAKDQAGQAIALNAVGWCQAQMGDYGDALTSCEQALDLHREIGNVHGEAETADSLGYVYHLLGRHQEAVAMYRRASDLCVALGDRHSRAVTLTHLGDTYHAAGDPRAAREVWQQALATLDELNHPGAEAVRAKLRQVCEAG